MQQTFDVLETIVSHEPNMEEFVRNWHRDLKKKLDVIHFFRFLRKHLGLPGVTQEFQCSLVSDNVVDVLVKLCRLIEKEFVFGELDEMLGWPARTKSLMNVLIQKGVDIVTQAELGTIPAPSIDFVEKKSQRYVAEKIGQPFTSFDLIQASWNGLRYLTNWRLGDWNEFLAPHLTGSKEYVVFLKQSKTLREKVTQKIMEATHTMKPVLDILHIRVLQLIETLKPLDPIVISHDEVVYTGFIENEPDEMFRKSFITPLAKVSFALKFQYEENGVTFIKYKYCNPQKVVEMMNKKMVTPM